MRPFLNFIPTLACSSLCIRICPILRFLHGQVYIRELALMALTYAQLAL